MVGGEGDDMPTGYRQVLAHLQQSGAGLSDGQLLARFVAVRDEDAFAALVRRHGPMVLGVCRRVLRDFHNAEDAFQGTFLVLARKAPALTVGESLACWLYRVAYQTALRAGAAAARRRAMERQVEDMPHPEVMPPEAQDWLPLLDRELSRLPEKYRAAIVLCDLEGRTRRDAARLLGIAEGTLSSRLATGRKMLAGRLAKCGVALSGGAVAVVLAQGVASARVSTALVSATAKAAALVVAGRVAAVSTTAVVLMREVMKAMLLKKLRLVAGAVVLVAALGAVGLGYQAGGGSGTAQAAPPDRPRTELEALRRENELLKLNLEVVLEKVRAQEAELRELRPRGEWGPPRRDSGLPRGSGGMAPGGMGMPGMPGGGMRPPGAGMSPAGGGGPPGMMPPGGGRGGYGGLGGPGPGAGKMPPGTGVPPRGGYGGPGPGAGGMQPGAGGPGAGGMQPGAGGPGGAPGGMSRTPTGPGTPGGLVADPVQEAESALKALREAKDPEGRRRATEALERALQKLKQQTKPQAGPRQSQ
jgi:RNA polymerase sigma factor (sigma-70 family)